MITEARVLGKIEILEDGQIQIREDTVIERDGKEITRLYHRRVLEPDVELNPSEPDMILNVAKAVWTSKVITSYKVKKSKLGLKNG
jgi:hypothetical protein